MKPATGSATEYIQQGPRYPVAVAYDGVLFFSGCTATDFSGGVYQQTIDILQQLEQRLHLAGSSRRSILSVTAYLRDVAEFEEHHRAWIDWLGADADRKPARTVVGAPLFQPDCRVELQIVAGRETPPDTGAPP